jgi:hypothetical protein
MNELDNYMVYGSETGPSFGQYLAVRGGEMTDATVFYFLLLSSLLNLYSSLLPSCSYPPSYQAGVYPNEPIFDFSKYFELLGLSREDVSVSMSVPSSVLNLNRAMQFPYLRDYMVRACVAPLSFLARHYSSNSIFISYLSSNLSSHLSSHPISNPISHPISSLIPSLIPSPTPSLTHPNIARLRAASSRSTCILRASLPRCSTTCSRRPSTTAT